MSVKFVAIFLIVVFTGATKAVPAEYVTALLEYREKCIAVSGSDEGYQQVLKSIPSAKACILNRLDVHQLQEDAKELASGARNNFFDKYCPKFNESMSCLDDTIEGIAKCVGDDFEQVKDIMKRIAHNLLDLMCQNGGQLFFDVQKPEYKTCVTHLKENGAQNCKLSDSTNKILISRYGEKECREIDESLKCFKRKVDECDAPRLYDVIRVVFDAISKVNDCKQVISLEEMSSNNIEIF